MDDREILERIHALVDEEHRLEQTDEPGKDLDRLDSIGVALDQCWDLLRQRRARRNAGLDPDEATVRPGWEVEGYEQ